ncbi:MAG: aminopeptidase P family protein [Bryobacteraceae bacterium]|nr:aminopeptidase P family protein [Bryobacteraceae bacterium]
MRLAVLFCLFGGLAPLLTGDGGIGVDEYQSRRKALREALKEGVIILVGGSESERGDLRTSFFQEPNFYYLTGWTQPGAILALSPEAEILFIPRRSMERERWTGPKAGPDDAVVAAITGIADVEPAEDFESRLPHLVKAAAKVYSLTTQPAAERLRTLLPLREFGDASNALAKLRMTKSPAEIGLIRRATDVTLQAHHAAWQRIAPGLYEYQIAATMSGTYFEAGCQRHAYPPIVGAGPNAAILHYSANSRRMDAGEVLLMDVAAECSYYVSDVTRTTPVNGKFTDRQKELYEIVLGAQRATIAAVKPGMTLSKTGPNSLYQVALDYLNAHGKDRNGKPLGQYFTHGIGHHVGLEVHDADDKTLPLAAGMIVTIEPGLYIPEENLGIRIEDVLLVTENGAEVLSAALPVAVDEIEQAMRR